MKFKRAIQRPEVALLLYRSVSFSIHRWPLSGPLLLRNNLTTPPSFLRLVDSSLSFLRHHIISTCFQVDSLTEQTREENLQKLDHLKKIFFKTKSLHFDISNDVRLFFFQTELEKSADPA